MIADTYENFRGGLQRIARLHKQNPALANTKATRALEEKKHPARLRA